MTNLAYIALSVRNSTKLAIVAAKNDFLNQIPDLFDCSAHEDDKEPGAGLCKKHANLLSVDQSGTKQEVMREESFVRSRLVTSPDNFKASHF